MGTGPPIKTVLLALPDRSQRLKQCRPQPSGDTVMLHVMDWGALPEELEELILYKLPLVNLARISTTCRLFQAVFRKQLAEEQKARCNLAAERFGPKRIAAICTLIKRGLQGETFDAYGSGRVPTWGWIAEDGTCRDERPGQCLPVVGFGMRSNSWYRDGRKGTRFQSTFTVVPIVRIWVSWSVTPPDILDPLYGVLITVNLSIGLELHGVALFQALLSEGLGRIFHDVGRHSELQITGFEALSTEGLETLLAPLLPLFSGRRRIVANRLVLGALM